MRKHRLEESTLSKACPKGKMLTERIWSISKIHKITDFDGPPTLGEVLAYWMDSLEEPFVETHTHICMYIYIEDHRRQYRFWFILMYSTCFHSLDDKRVLVQLLFQLCNLQASAISLRKMPRSGFTSHKPYGGWIWACKRNIGKSTSAETEHFRSWHDTRLSKHVCVWYNCTHTSTYTHPSMYVCAVIYIHPHLIDSI